MSVTDEGFYNIEVFSVLNNRPLGGSAENETLQKKSKKEGLVMETPEVLNSKVLKAFTRGSFVIIGLFVVLYCVVVFALVIHFGANFDGKAINSILVLAIPLIIFLIIFLVVFFGFLCLVKSYYDKSCRSSCIICEGTFLKMHKFEAMLDACLILVKTIKSDSGKDECTLQKLIEKILEQSSKISIERSK